jgi:hypothetical protein
MKYLIINKFDLKSKHHKPVYNVETTTDSVEQANEKLKALNLLNEHKEHTTFLITALNEDVLLLTKEMLISQ